MERRGGREEQGCPGCSLPPLWRNIFKGGRTKKELTPGPGQVDTSGDEVTTGDEDADKEEEEVGRRQQHHVFHLCDWNDFQSILFSDFCAIYKDLCKQIIIFVLGC